VAEAARGSQGSARYLAALAAFGLGLLAAVMMIAGHPPWQGPEVVSLSETHGLHEGDALAVGPFVVGIALAWWCLRRRPGG
jgi:peptidoglycan/LPS O-acetylase OafA/YrhL